MVTLYGHNLNDLNVVKVIQKRGQVYIPDFKNFYYAVTHYLQTSLGYNF